MAQADTKLLIVYNADSGMFNAVMHALHKTLKPETYPCSLCALTYGAVSMHGDWKHFLDAIPLPVVFHHRDDFAADYPDADVPLPAVLIKEPAAAPEILISADLLDAMDARDDLIAVLEKCLVERLGPRMLAARRYLA